MNLSDVKGMRGHLLYPYVKGKPLVKVFDFNAKQDTDVN